MKRIIFISFFLIRGFLIHAQSITLNSPVGCFNTDVATFSASNGQTPARNIYTGNTNGGNFPLRILWDNSDSKWKTQVDFGSGFLTVDENAFASYPNPPRLGTGLWDNVALACEDLNQFDGSGTQTTLVVLPIELINFYGTPQNSNVQLFWQTATETNNEKFEIEYSSNGTAFRTIGEEKGQGTTLEEHNYKFVHENVEEATAYYRLKQIDFDGNFSYSEVVSVTLEREEGSIDIFPNPSNDGLINLIIDSEEIMDINIQISDLTGKRIQSTMRAIDAGKNNLELDLSTLGKGLFIIEIEKGTQLFYERILIQ